MIIMSTYKEFLYFCDDTMILKKLEYNYEKRKHKLVSSSAIPGHEDIGLLECPEYERVSVSGNAIYFKNHFAPFYDITMKNL